MDKKIDEQKLKMLFNEHYKGLCAFARQFIFDIEKAKDIVQDVFLNVWEKGELIDSDSKIKSYLYTSVRNRCLNYIRDNKKFNNNIEVATLEQSGFTNNMEYKELEKLIMTTIDELPEKCREVFVLSRFNGLKYQEIADKLGISIKTVEAQMSKALKSLKEKISSSTTNLFLFFINIFKSSVRVLCSLSV